MSQRTTIPSPDTLIAHAGFIRAVARKLLLDDHEVDDVVQQTLLAALENPPRREGPLKPWLATVARNLARMRRRTEGRVHRREQAAARPESMPATGEIAARLELQRKLVEAVTSLDEPYRDVVVLRFFDELPPREVARRLGLPVETVRTRTRRALEQLRGQLDRKSVGGRKAWQLALLPLALPPARAQAAVATATVGILGVLGVKSIATIAAVLFAAVVFVWHEAAGDSESVASRVEERRRGGDSKTVGASASGASIETGEQDGGGARGTHGAADFVYRGVVVDEEGEPVRGARVSASEHGIRVTDSDGEFRVDGRAGEHVLRVAVKKDGYVPLKGAISAWSDVAERFVLSRGRELRVRVLSPRGLPVAGARCAAVFEKITRRGSNWSVVTWNDEREAVSDAEGFVALGRVNPVDLALEVDHPDFAWFSGEWTEEDLAGGEVEVRLSLGGTVRGMVRGPDGKPVAGAVVSVRTRSTTSGADGRYELGHVGTDGVHVKAKHPNYAAAAFGAVLGWNDDIPVRVAEGGEVEGIDILLGEATRVRGRFVDHKGDPVAGLTVNAYAVGAVSYASSKASDEQGRFEAGPYTLRNATTTWRIYATNNSVHSVPEGHKWILRRGETLDVGDITVQTRPIVRGRVLDPSGNPIAPSVQATVETGRSLGWVDPDGTFEVQVEAGTQRFFAAATGEDGVKLRSEPRMLDLKVDETIDVELRLRATVPVSGRVMGSNKAPPNYAAVALVPVDTPVPWKRGMGYESVAGREGNFRFHVGKPGEYIAGIRVSAGKQGLRFRADVPTQKITVGDQPIEGLSFVVPVEKKSGMRVFGRVVAAKTGKPVKNYALRLIKYKFFMPDHTYYFGVRDGDGRFEQWMDKPGTYAAKISVDGYSAYTTKTFAVETKGEMDLGTIKLQPALKLRGLVRDSNGTPVPYAQIHLLGGRGDVGGQTFSGSDGRFVIDDADVGVYNIFAVSPRHPVAVLKGVTVRHGRKNDVTIEVPDTSPLTIRVKDENGRPIEGARLVWTFPAIAPFTSNEFGGYEPPSFGANQSDSEGVIRKPYTPSAPITVRILKKGFVTDSRVIRTKKGQPIAIEVVLQRR